MFIDVVPNGRSAPAVLLRESWREGKRVRKRTIANLGPLPPAVIDGLRVLLAGGTVVARLEEVFEIQRALPHGHVAAVVGMMRKLDLSRLLSRTASRQRDLALAMIASRLIAPGSKLATLRALAPETASSSLGRVLDLGVIEEREIYAALDWVLLQTPGAARVAVRWRDTERVGKHDGCGSGQGVQRPALHGRGDPVGAAVVSGVPDQLPRPRLDAVGPRRRGRPLHPVPLGKAYAATLEKRIRRHLRSCTGSWRVDETYIKVKGVWTYLYRAVDSLGQTIDFRSSPRRDAAAAKLFFRKAPAPSHTPSIRGRSRSTRTHPTHVP